MATVLAFDVYGTMIDTNGVVLACATWSAIGHPLSPRSGATSSWNILFVKV